MPKFQHLPTVVEAHRMDYGGSLDTPQGRVEWDVDDWMIHGVNGICYPITNDVFQNSYDPIDAEATEYLARVTRR